MKILNLYGGIGGNRKLWQGDIQVTAIESNKEIAKAYKELFPMDNVIVCDAHQYLIDNFENYDFIWTSPPCPTHSKLNLSLKGYGIYRYPSMDLYEEIIFLKTFYKGAWVVENVLPYYEFLISPTATIDRHALWSNLNILEKNFKDKAYNVSRANKEALSEAHGINLPDWVKDKRKLIRNAVNPRIGEYIFSEVIKSMEVRV